MLRKIIIVFLCLIICVSICSCNNDNSSGNDNSSYGTIKLPSEPWEFHYYLKTTFEIKEDKAIFEQRLSAMGFSIEKQIASGDTVEYDLKSNFSFAGEMELLCGSYELKIYDEDRNEILTKSDVDSLSRSWSTLGVKTDMHFAEGFFSKYWRQKLIFELNGKDYYADVWIDDGILQFTIVDDPKTVVKSLLAWSSENPKGNITIEDVKIVKITQ